MKFFGGFSASGVLFMPRLEDTFDHYLKMLLAMVLVFQLPPIVFALAKTRLVTARFLWRNIKYAILRSFSFWPRCSRRRPILGTRRYLPHR